ncbi:MAG: ComEA family DNA-binding protein [Planctomycetales bacterium]
MFPWDKLWPVPDPKPAPRPDPAVRAGAIDVVVDRPAGTDAQQQQEQQQSALNELRQAALRAAGVLPHPTLSADERPRFWLRRTDQLLVASLVAALLVSMFVQWGRLSGWGKREVEIERMTRLEYLYRIDINRATWVEWAQFEGIGEAMAHRIVADRERNGPFASVDDVLRVPGIGPVKMRTIRPHLYLGTTESEPDKRDN